MQAYDAAVSHSPSFNSYSNSDLTEIAARVVEECAAEEKSDDFYDEFYFEREVDSESVTREGEEWDGGFEFEFGTRDSESSTISVDEIFHDGKILPVYPFFDADFLIRKVKMDSDKDESGKKKIRLPLMKLLIEERESAVTTSDVDELEGVPEELYFVWQPKTTPEETAPRCKKSSSTGSVYKKLKSKELLPRSHSEGRKDNIVFLTPKNSKLKETPVPTGKLRPPYGQDLVGFLSGGNGLTKNSKPF